MKRLWPHFLFASVLFLNGCFIAARWEGRKTVLQVGKFKITAQEFAEDLAQKLNGHHALVVKDPIYLKSAKEELLSDLVKKLLVRNWALNQGIKVTAQQLDEEINRIRKAYPNDSAFRESLAESNVSFENWKADLEDTLLEKLVYQTVTKDTEAVSDKEIKTFFDSNPEMFKEKERARIRQIVLEKEDDAQRVEKALNSGESFSELAKKYSVAPEATFGGEVGWVERGTLEVFDLGFKMTVNTRSKIIKSPYGFHIMEVLGKKPARTMALQEARPKIESLLRANKERIMFQAWLEKQIQTVPVLKNEELLASMSVKTND